MITTLATILGKFGLSLNTRKTKIFDVIAPPGAPCLLDTGVGFVEVVQAGCKHKYLGRSMDGDLKRRRWAALHHRISCGWMKFSQLRSSLCDKRVNIKLRLRLLDSVITPTVCYGLDSCALTTNHMEKLDAVQRRMLRSIVGWCTFRTEESWEDRGRKMALRMSHAMLLHPVVGWSHLVEERKRSMKDNLSALPDLVQFAIAWDPVRWSHLNSNAPKRKRGPTSHEMVIYSACHCIT